MSPEEYMKVLTNKVACPRCASLDTGKITYSWREPEYVCRACGKVFEIQYKEVGERKHPNEGY